MLSLHAAMSAFIKKAKYSQSQHFYLPMPILQFLTHQSYAEFSVQAEHFLQVSYMSFRKCTIFISNCLLLRCSLADTSTNHMARSRGTLVPHLVRILYSKTLLTLVHMNQGYYMLTLGSQCAKKAFQD